MSTGKGRRPARPFAEVKQREAGWFAEARVGMSSGPWDAEAQAQAVVDKWNAATAWPA